MRRPAPAQRPTSGPVPGSQEDLVANVGDRVFFDFDRSTLTTDARATLDRQAGWLGKYPQVNVQVAGNCDDRGTEEYNLALGQRRANSSRDYLVARGRRGLADQHDQLRQGSSDGARRQRAGLGAEPQRDHLGPLSPSRLIRYPGLKRTGGPRAAGFACPVAAT